MEIVIMSIVVAVKKDGLISVASDTQASFGETTVPIKNHKAHKIRRFNTSIIGKCGWALYENILDDYLDKKNPPLTDQKQIFKFFREFWKDLHLRYAFVNDQCDDDERSPFGDLDASFIIAHDGGIFNISANMNITEFKEYYAIGSGADFALGALYSLYDSDLNAAELAKKAVQTAMAFDLFCGGDIESLTI